MANNSFSIAFHSLTGGFTLKQRTQLKQFLAHQAKSYGKQIDHINYIFCDDAHLLTINRQYLDHNTLTDIITFELSKKGDPLLSDIYISVERVRENSGVFKTTFRNELHRVIFHGLLHLLGFSDKSIKHSKQMRLMEQKLLDEYFTWNIN